VDQRRFRSNERASSRAGPSCTGQSEEAYQDYGWASAVHPDDAQPTIDAWNQAVAEKRTFEMEHRVRRHDGEWRNFSIRAVPVVQNGEIAEWVGVTSTLPTSPRRQRS
jgi:PAS domain S-box-containing protein